jgi:hypothetical protein
MVFMLTIHFHVVTKVKKDVHLKAELHGGLTDNLPSFILQGCWRDRRFRATQMCTLNKSE